MRDQAALVRESVKWDFELREPEQIADLVDRAYAVSNSLPKGPVYLSLPREPLCELYECTNLGAAPVIVATSYAPDPSALAMAAELIAKAKKPVIFSQRGADRLRVSVFYPTWLIAGASRQGCSTLYSESMKQQWQKI